LDRSHNDATLHEIIERLQPEIDNHIAAVALNYFAYNFIKIHRTLRVTPAMAARVTDRPWEVSDLVAILEQSESIKSGEGVQNARSSGEAHD
jgi:hypothetical protein